MFYCLQIIKFIWNESVEKRETFWRTIREKICTNVMVGLL